MNWTLNLQFSNTCQWLILSIASEIALLLGAKPLPDPMMTQRYGIIDSASTVKHYRDGDFIHWSLDKMAVTLQNINIFLNEKFE